MKKILLPVLLLPFIFQCSCRKPLNTNLIIKDTVRIVIKDTIFIKQPDPNDRLMGTVKGLLIDYYQAGWMEAQNAMIDLYNKDNMTDKAVEKQRFLHFRKIESKVNNKP